MRAILFIILILSTSCAAKKELSVPKYTSSEAIAQGLVEAHEIPVPSDTTKVIVVYNVVEKDTKGTKISDETIRLFISDVFSTIVTILTIHNLDQANGQ